MFNSDICGDFFVYQLETFNFQLKNLHGCKFFTTFVAESYAGGYMSCEKRFAMVLSG